MSLRPKDPNDNTARYTTVDLVKERLAIDAGDTSRDDQILQAIVAAQWAIDVYCGRGFPDIPPDEEITVVPGAIANAALSLAISYWKEADAPTGTGGSDAFFGTVSFADTAREMLDRSPGLIGFRVSWGTG